MEPINLPAMLSRIINEIYLSPHSETGIPYIKIGNHTLSTTDLAIALLTESISPQKVAEQLWDRLGTSSAAAKFLGSFDIIERSQTNHPIMLSFKAGEIVWGDFVRFCQGSDAIKTSIYLFAEDWFKTLLLPFVRKPRIASATKEDWVEYLQEDLKKNLLERDGITCLVDNSTEMTLVKTDLTHYDKNAGAYYLEAAYVIPVLIRDRFGLGTWHKELHADLNRGRTLDYIDVFTGGTIKADSLRHGLSKASNRFLLNSTTRRAYDTFSLSISADVATTKTTYFLEAHRDHLGTLMDEKAKNRTPLQLGRLTNRDLPNPEFCNLHFSIGRLLRASGAREIIDTVLQEEEDVLEDSEHVATTPGPSETRSLFYINRQLEGFAVEEDKEKIEGL